MQSTHGYLSQNDALVGAEAISALLYGCACRVEVAPVAEDEKPSVAMAYSVTQGSQSENCSDSAIFGLCE